MSKPEFVYTTFIKTTPEKLWHALTDTEFTRSYWFGCSLSSDWKVGSRMHMDRDGKVVNECVVLESDPPRRLSYSWHSIFDDEMKKERPSRVTFVLEPNGSAVKLTVTHEDFAEGSKVLPSISGGWPLVLSSLKSILETGQPLDFEMAKE
ncbi:ATPase [Afipia sp. Root123D2]|uniref:SRPBCC family protein n=1 Tax=Afipia sp. Root123D2 TaxID=1736436 RepID=UPI0006F99142|nr:SRPBCC family protein [Afipia sp. Root123D2]KQW21951.1 ATPase [Afipia sp. Root123D2]